MTGPSLTSATCMCAPKTPVGTGRPSSLRQRVDESVEGRLRDWRRRGARPRRPVALARRRVQRELGDGENAAASLRDGQVHHAGVVVEDAHLHDLAREPVAIVRRIVATDARQHQESRADGADDVAVDADTRVAHPLHQRPHLTILRSTSSHDAVVEDEAGDRLRIARRRQVAPARRLAALAAARDVGRADARDDFAFAHAGHDEFALGDIDAGRGAIFLVGLDVGGALAGLGAAWTGGASGTTRNGMTESSAGSVSKLRNSRPAGHGLSW